MLHCTFSDREASLIREPHRKVSRHARHALATDGDMKMKKMGSMGLLKKFRRKTWDCRVILRIACNDIKMALLSLLGNNFRLG